MVKLETLENIPIFRMIRRRDFDRLRPEAWFLIFGFVFIFIGLILSSLKVFLWLGGLVLFIYFAAIVIWVIGKIN